MCRAVVLIIIFNVWLCHTIANPKLVIDQDGGADDSMAIFLALLYEKYFNGPEVVAITTSHGNADECQVFENTQKILDIAQRRDVPIFRGSNNSLVTTYPSDNYFGYDGLGDLGNITYEPIEAQPQHAVNALIELSKKYEGNLVVIAIGALTNIALAVRLDPLFISRLGHLYLAAGNTQSTAKYPQYNAWMDVEGYYVVVQNSTPEKVTSIFSHLLDNTISMDWRQNVLGAIDTPLMRAQYNFERVANAGQKVWKLLDPQAMAIALDPTLVKEYKCDNNSIILCGDKRGYNTDSFIDCNDSNIKVAFKVSQDGVMSFLYDVFYVQLLNQN